MFTKLAGFVPSASMTVALSAALLVMPPTPSPAFATTASVRLSAGSAVDDGIDQLAWARAQVRRLAELDPRWQVQSAALSALVNDDPEAPTRFLSPGGGHERARDRAAKEAKVNDSIIKLALATSHPLTSPNVFAAATRASRGTLVQKDRFVRTGLQEAQALDAQGVGNGQHEATNQAAADRAFVTDLAAHAPGAWVRAAAGRAITLGTDGDIAEFFKYAWVSSAACDTEAFRIDVADQNALYRNRLAVLIEEAKKAQTAFEGASEAAKAKAAEVARTSWNAAADVAATTQAKWLAEQVLASSQAQSWAAVLAFALAAATDQDWTAIADQAAGLNRQWSDEVIWAQEQARLWTALAESARASANALPSFGAPPVPSASNVPRAAE
jgi:hypothetical protein